MTWSRYPLLDLLLAVLGEMPNQANKRDNPTVARDTLIDFFRDLSALPGEFLADDDRSLTASYTKQSRLDAPRADLRQSSPEPASTRATKSSSGREPPGMDRVLLGMSHRRHHRGADRLSLVGRIRRQGQPARGRTTNPAGQ